MATPTRGSILKGDKWFIGSIKENSLLNETIRESDMVPARITLFVTSDTEVEEL